MLPLPVALVNQVKMLQTVNITPKTIKWQTDRLEKRLRARVCVCDSNSRRQPNILTNTFSVCPCVFISPCESCIYRSKQTKCMSDSPWPQPSQRNLFKTVWGLELKLSASLKKEKRERHIDKDKLRLHLMNTISISHLFLHMLLSSSPQALLRSPAAEKGSTPHLFPITFFNSV